MSQGGSRHTGEINTGSLNARRAAVQNRINATNQEINLN